MTEIRPTLPDGLPDPDWSDPEFGIALYRGDCLEILPKLPRVDAVITDPPYGVNFAGKSTKWTERSGIGYNSKDDPAVGINALKLWNSKRSVITPGVRNAHNYPNPDDWGGIFYPSGAGLSKWGFTCFQPIFYYGKCPYLAQHLGSHPNSFPSTDSAEVNGHPCPKPIKTMEWLVSRGSLISELILDPFMCSGTTGVAAVNLDRSFIGIELDPDYFKISVQRIRKAIIDKQNGPLFAEHKPQQAELIEAIG